MPTDGVDEQSGMQSMIYRFAFVLTALSLAVALSSVYAVTAMWAVSVRGFCFPHRVRPRHMPAATQQRSEPSDWLTDASVLRIPP